MGITLFSVRLEGIYQKIASCFLLNIQPHYNMNTHISQLKINIKWIPHGLL